MPQVPGSLAELVSLFAGCFTQPTFRTFRALLVGFIARVGEHTITGCLVAGGVAGDWHHSRGHRFFSRARWSPDRLGLVLLDLIVARLVDPGAPLLVAIDDTLLRRSGRRVWGTAWHHEPTCSAPPRRFAWGNNWVVAAIVVRLPFLEPAGRAARAVQAADQARGQQARARRAADSADRTAFSANGASTSSVTATTPVRRWSASQTSR